MVGITSQTVDFANYEAERTFDDVLDWSGVVPPIRVVSDPTNELAAYYGVALSPILPVHPHGYAPGSLMAQPACIASNTDGQTLYKWILKPSVRNGLGTLGRPVAKEVWEVCEAKINGKPVLEEDIHAVTVNRNCCAGLLEVCQRVCPCCICWRCCCSSSNT